MLRSREVPRVVLLETLCVLVAIVGVLAVTLPASAQSISAQNAPVQPQVLAAWSQILGGASVQSAGLPAAPRVEMRFVVHGGTPCGSFSVSTRAVVGGSWLPASGITPTKRVNTYMPLQGVDICSVSFTGPLAGQWYQARLEFGGQVAVLTSQLVGGDTRKTVGSSFTPGAADGSEVVVYGPRSIGSRNSDGLVAVTLGDTGCRGLPESGSSRDRQTCDPTGWPLAELSSAAAALKPDLVLHVGDYRYFLEETVSADSWLYWQKDFFPAAQPLLLAAPWVFTRGNHEECQVLTGWGFGEAYFQLFGTPINDNCVRAMEPWYFDVAAGGLGSGQASHRFVMIDTSDDAAAAIQANFESAAKITQAQGAPDSAWWVSHIPALNLIFYSDDEHTGDTSIRQDLLQAESSTGAYCGANGCRPSMFLLGHEHLFQSIEFPDGSGGWSFPQQVIVGHGGVRIDNSSPAPAPDANCKYDGFELEEGSDDAAGFVTTEVIHGFVQWTRNAQTESSQPGWMPQMHWVSGATPRPLSTGTPEACEADPQAPARATKE